MDPYALSASVTLLTNAIAARLDDDALAVVASALCQMGDAMSLIAAQRAVCSSGQESQVKEHSLPPGSDSPASPAL